MVDQELWAELEGREGMGLDKIKSAFWEVNEKIACMEWAERP